MKLTSEQEKVINENPHIRGSEIANLIGCNARTVRRNRRSCWSYSGVGIPFLVFDGSFRVKYKHKFIFVSSSRDKAIAVVDHLIWCIENNMFNQPRIEHPYFEKLSLIKE